MDAINGGRPDRRTRERLARHAARLLVADPDRDPEALTGEDVTATAKRLYGGWLADPISATEADAALAAVLDS